VSQTPPGFTLAEHDWHSGEYVEKWIARDVTRTERPQRLTEMLALAAFPKDAPIKVLDVGGGNGIVTETVLQLFPNARVTLQDYSAAMLDRARERFASYGEQVSYALSDLFDPAWAASARGPFDLVVSSIALHNLAEMTAITAAYREIYGLLGTGGIFLNCDHLRNIGGVELHLETLKSVGFAKAECPSDENPAITAAYK
jgi:ubiquinone/menaquinone biosynthesis C-methylase UbiE